MAVGDRQASALLLLRLTLARALQVFDTGADQFVARIGARQSNLSQTETATSNAIQTESRSLADILILLHTP